MKTYIETNHSRPVHTFPALYMAKAQPDKASSAYNGMVVLATNMTTGTVVVPPTEKNTFRKYTVGFHCGDWDGFDNAAEWVPLYGKVVIDTTDK